MCSWIPFVRDSPTLPARPVRGRSSARRQHLAMAPYINSYLMVPRAVAYVSLGTFLSSSAGCVAGGSRAAAPPPRRDSTSREEPPTPPSHRDELRPRTDSDNKRRWRTADRHPQCSQRPRLASAPDARLPTCANQDSRGAIWQMDPAVVVVHCDRLQ